MTVKTGDLIRWIITFVLLIFHCTVTFFIFYMMKIQKNKSYMSTYFLLYLIISISDIVSVIKNFLQQKIILIDPWKPWFFEHPQWDTVLWLISGYLIYFQSLAHASVAINRAWISISFIAKNRPILPKIGNNLIWLLPIIPVAIAAPRFPGHSMYYYTKEGELASKYNETYIQIYHSTAGPTVVLSTSALSFILGIGTILRYRYIFKQYKTLTTTMKKDMLLFGQAVIVFISQVALAAYYVITLYATSQNLLELKAFASIYFGYINDITCLCNPIALLIVCKFIQKDFISFMLRRKRKVNPCVSVWKNSSAPSRRLSDFVVVT